jgi:DNA-binding NarL/FixJ family response regulator
LFDSLEGRLAASEDRGRAVAGQVATLRTALANALQRVDELSFLQDGLEVRINDLDADEARDCRSGNGHEPCPLSAREVEVLAHLAEGMVYKQIALEMSLSASTVRSHLHRIYGKTGAVDRAQAVLLARSRGWL